MRGKLRIVKSNEMCQVMHLRIVFLIVSNDVVMCFLCENH